VDKEEKANYDIAHYDGSSPVDTASTDSVFSLSMNLIGIIMQTINYNDRLSSGMFFCNF